MLSIAINVKNGERYLARCLNALTGFNDIVMLDNFSTDNTVAIAKSYPNVRVFEVAFCGMGKLRNILSQHAYNDWIFFVDSDEIVNSKLARILLKYNFSDNTIYQLLRYNFYDNFLVDSSSWGNDWVSRIFNRKQTQYTETEVHESVASNGMAIKKISGGFIYHFPYETVLQLIDKMQFYSTLYAKQNFGKKKVKLSLIPLRSFTMFIKCYIFKLGFLQGYEGFVISSYNAIGVFSKYIKLYELSYRANITLALSISQNQTDLNDLINGINSQKLLPTNILFITDETLSPDLTSNIKNKLVIPFLITLKTHNDYATVIHEYLNNNSSTAYIAHVTQSRLMYNNNFFKQVKNGILRGKQLSQTNLYIK